MEFQIDLSDVPPKQNLREAAAAKYFNEIEYLVKLGYYFTEVIQILAKKGVNLNYVAAKKAYERRKKKIAESLTDKSSSFTEDKSNLKAANNGDAGIKSQSRNELPSVMKDDFDETLPKGGSTTPLGAQDMIAKAQKTAADQQLGIT